MIIITTKQNSETVNENNLDILKKVIEGNENVTEFKIDGVPEPLKLKPLTSMEIMELQKIEKKGQKAMLNISQIVAEKDKNKRRKNVEDQIQKMESELDYSIMRENQSKVKFKAISYSASIPEHVVFDLPNYLVGEIFDMVMKISNVSKKELDMLTDFPDDESGEDDN